MSNRLQQNSGSPTHKTLAAGWTPTHINFIAGKNTIIDFSNNRRAHASCLRCKDAPCATLSVDEMSSIVLEEFPADRNQNICAASAITVNSNGVPEIDADRCILCGVCASRCPIGAIKLMPDIGAVVEDSPNEAFVLSANCSSEQKKTQIRAFNFATSSGSLLSEEMSLLDNVFRRLYAAWAREGERFPIMLSRNLLIAAGIPASATRKGSVYMRMDLVLSPPGLDRGVAEVEFGQEAVLEAPRNTLDALAVLSSRYRWELTSTTAIILTDSLPNKRSEFWHVLKDIKQVLGIKIGTVTSLSLLLCIWNRLSLEHVAKDIFYIDLDSGSYRTEVLEELIGRPLNLEDLLAPYVEIIK